MGGDERSVSEPEQPDASPPEPTTSWPTTSWQPAPNRGDDSARQWAVGEARGQRALSGNTGAWPVTQIPQQRRPDLSDERLVELRLQASLGTARRPLLGRRTVAFLVCVVAAVAGSVEAKLWLDGRNLLPWLPARVEEGVAPDLTRLAARRTELGYPPPGYEAGSVPLGQPPAPGTTSASYAFFDVQEDGRPVAWDPCRPIHYVVGGSAPKNGAAMIAGAVKAISDATGLVFVDDGPTDEQPSPEGERPLMDSARYGPRWAPVLISWDTPDANPALSGDTAGRGGPERVAYAGVLYNVSGAVSLDAPQLAVTPDATAVVMHELAHVVGLDHVDDPAELMNPRAVAGVREFGAGDLAGLALLGQGTCEPGL